MRPVTMADSLTTKCFIVIAGGVANDLAINAQAIGELDIAFNARTHRDKTLDGRLLFLPNMRDPSLGECERREPQLECLDRRTALPTNFGRDCFLPRSVRAHQNAYAIYGSWVARWQCHRQGLSPAH
jgi:hypothetical protein